MIAQDKLMIEEKDNVIAQDKLVIEEKDNVIAQDKLVIEEKDNVIAQQDKKIIEIIDYLKMKNISLPNCIVGIDG